MVFIGGNSIEAKAASQHLIATARWYGRELGEQFLAADCLSRSAVLTYTTLFAVVPMMTVAYAMFSLLPEFSDLGERARAFVFENFIPARSAQLQDKLVEFSERARGLTAVGFAFLFVTAFLMLVTIERTFNGIWGIVEPRHGLVRFLLYWGVLSLGPSLIAAGLFISLYLTSLPLIADLRDFGLGQVLLGYLPFLLGTAGFTLLYYAVPNCHVPFRNALVGGVVATALFELAKTLFGVVMANSIIEPIYGTFAAVPLFLAWLYMVWVLVLSGAILVRTLSLTPELTEERPEPLLVKCARVIKLLQQAHLEGAAVAEDDIQLVVPMNRIESDRIFAVLHEFRLLSQTEDELWTLGRSLRSLTLWDLYQRMPEGLDLDRLAEVDDLPGVVEPLVELVQYGSCRLSGNLDEVFGGVN